MPTGTASERTEYLKNRTLAIFHKNNPTKNEGGNRPLDCETLLNRIVGSLNQDCCENNTITPIQIFGSPGLHTLTIPVGYTKASIDVIAGGGGAGDKGRTNQSTFNENGAHIAGTITVSSGDIFTIYVGGGGTGGTFSDGGLGGSGGGADGSAAVSTYISGGGGGGYSSITLNNSLSIVAGGGGGGGKLYQGGNGGNRYISSNYSNISGILVVNGENGGLDISRGLGGSTVGGIGGEDEDTNKSFSGTGPANGTGNGSSGGSAIIYSAGGGGAGYYGGGGGGGFKINGGGGGGGGGSSFINTNIVTAPDPSLLSTFFPTTRLEQYGLGGINAGSIGQPGYVKVVLS